MKTKKYLFGTLCIVLMLVLLCGCTSNNHNNGNNPMATPTPKPHIVVTSQASRTGYSGIDFCAFIDIIVKNYGNAGGSSDIWVELKQDTNTARKHQTIYLYAGETESLTITFCELSFWSGGGFTYRVWAENH